MTTGSPDSTETETGSDTGFDTASDPTSVSGSRSPVHDAVLSSDADLQGHNLPHSGHVLDLRHRSLDSSVVCGAFSETLEKLNVSDCQMHDVPEGVWDTTNIQVLNIAANFIESLPGTIGQLQWLRELYVDFNQLRELPSEVGSLCNLTILTASGNRFDAVPDALSWLCVLQSLRLASNIISRLPPPSFWQSLTSLTTLDLRRNSIVGTADFSTLQSLRSLDVSWNQIEHLVLPDGNLHQLDCSYNALQELCLPGHRLQTLSSSHNSLHSVTHVPQQSILEYVDLSSNNLEIVPDWVPELTHLCHLDLSYNFLTSVPARLFGPALKRLDTLRLNHNQISSLPERTPECFVRHLDLQHNALERGIPADIIFHSPRLEWLNVSHNELMSLPLPPSEATSLPLQWLLLSTTGITDSMLWPLVLASPKLKVLQAAHNKLEIIPTSISKLVHLRDIMLSGNSIRTLPTGISSLPVLEVLLLSGNHIDELPNFAECAALRVLDVSCNVLSEVALPSVVSPNLQQLDISCNQALFVDTQEFHHLCSKKNVSVVDTKFCGRLAPPFKPNSNGHSGMDNLFWETGFSESPKGHARLYINQYTQPCGQLEVLAAIVESPQRQLLTLAKTAIAELVREERRCSETSSTFLQNIILATYRALGGRVCCHQLNIALCHVLPAVGDPCVQYDAASGMYEVTVAHMGPATCLLARGDSALSLADSSPVGSSKCIAEDWYSAVQAGFGTTELRRAPRPCSLPNPSVRRIQLCHEDRLLVLSSATLSDALSPEAVLQQAFAAGQPMAAAKRLGDSVTTLTSDAGTCVIVLALQRTPGAPSTLQGRSVHFRITTDIDDPDEAEAYKAWEYMLAQNHKLLFTRELETLQRSFVKSRTAIGGPTIPASEDPDPAPVLSGRLKKRYCYGLPATTTTTFVQPTNII
ncbi:PH domain leucine-rich repeat-containing protein phosphatase 2-like [Ornithodoros turicata]|uniref:PH domain leucine-rich repeat-containing protein phosphatase 2-like n=1 Tax=Ornithodoros turicata TaxID=34597 RepID=UPI0031390A8F